MSFIGQISSIMDYSVRKREAIANNISNQATPDYKAQSVKWNELLGQNSEMRLTNKGHISVNDSGKSYTIGIDSSTQVNSDGNNVDSNKEILEMVKNNQLFSISLQALNEYYEASGAARGR